MTTLTYSLPIKEKFVVGNYIISFVFAGGLGTHWNFRGPHPGSVGSQDREFCFLQPGNGFIFGDESEQYQFSIGKNSGNRVEVSLDAPDWVRMPCQFLVLVEEPEPVQG